MTTRRLVLVLAASLLVWGIVVLQGGGFVLDTRWGTISSRAAIRPLVGAGLVLLLYVSRWRRHWRTDLGPLARVPPAPVVAWAAIAFALTVGLGWGTSIAGGPDASGYVSFADMLARGRLTMPAPEWAIDAPWDNAALTASPVGYRPTSETSILAPTYSPGFPLIMALFQIVGGPETVFYVVPILGAIAVWATWRIGWLLGGAWTGAAAATLVATSGTFAMMIVTPLSDVPAAACWSVAILAALHGRPWASGLATALAILVRPNIVPLAFFPFALLWLHDGARRIGRVSAYALAVVPGAAAIAALNWYYHASPLRSGYGTLGELYSSSRIVLNLERYRSWFFQSQTALPLAGLAAPAFALRGRERMRVLLVTTLLPLALLALYLPYFVFQAYEWSYLRFLLPAYPSLMIGFAMVLAGAARRIPNAIVGRAVPTIVVAAVALYCWEFARANGVLAFKDSDNRYARVVDHVRTLPPRSIVVSLAHSGTIHLYARRDVLRFEALPTYEMDKAIFTLLERGYNLYLAGDEFEIDMFRERIAGTRTAALLAKAPHVDLGGSAVYTLSARGSGKT
jgi:hypothetical protein